MALVKRVLPRILCSVWIYISVTNCLARSQQAEGDLPNIIFMMADDLGYGDVGYNGGIASTPNLDSLAAGPNTILLNRYYSGAPVCSPTRGSVLTGRNPNRYCIWFANTGHSSDFKEPETMPLPPTEVTVAEVLKNAGYRTAIFGKWHLGDLKKLKNGNAKWPVSHPGMHGFDDWLVTERSTPTYNLNCACFADESSLCQPLGHNKHTKGCTNYYTIRDGESHLDPVQYPIRGEDSDFIVTKFEEFLNRTREEGTGPFFAYLPFHNVHTQYIASPENAQRYQSFGLNKADYYGATTAMDSAVGRVRTLLQSHNISHNTMLWFTSDNGPAASSPGTTAGLRGRKNMLFEGGIRVPGLIEWPAMIKNNRQSEYPVVSSDLLPTVSDIVGFDVSSTGKIMDGISILPMIRNEQVKRDSTIKWAHKIPRNFSGSYAAVIMNDRFKLYASYEQDRVVSSSLYDLVNDRHERVDVQSSHEGVFESLGQELETWRQSVIYSATHEVQCYGEQSDTPSTASSPILSETHNEVPPTTSHISPPDAELKAVASTPHIAEVSTTTSNSSTLRAHKEVLLTTSLSSSYTEIPPTTSSPSSPGTYNEVLSTTSGSPGTYIGASSTVPNNNPSPSGMSSGNWRDSSASPTLSSPSPSTSSNRTLSTVSDPNSPQTSNISSSLTTSNGIDAMPTRSSASSTPAVSNSSIHALETHTSLLGVWITLGILSVMGIAAAIYVFIKPRKTGREIAKYTKLQLERLYYTRLGMESSDDDAIDEKTL